MVNNLEKFLSEAVGLKYGIGGNKLLKKKTEKVENTENELINEDRTFFCSELVAKAFKLLGVMENDETSCAQFYPHHFSSRGDSFLKLCPGTKIEAEMQIIVDHSDLKDDLLESLPADE